MANIVVQVPAGNIVTTGISLMVYANRFRRAAEPLYQSRTKMVSFDPVIYFLYCQSLELHLKSFIWLEERVTPEQLKTKYGHRLGDLWKQAIKDRVSEYVAVTDLRNRVIELVDPYYKKRQFNYLDLNMAFVGFNDLRAEPRAIATLRRLTGRFETALKRPILRSS